MADTGGALAGIAVLDLTQGVAGPYCTKLFLRLRGRGAESRAPGVGDPTRRAGPFPDDEPHPERSGLFLDLNTGKQSLTLDLKDGDRKAHPEASGRRGRSRRSRTTGPARSRASVWTRRRSTAANPAATLVSISNFGQSGPHRDLEADDMLAYAMSGGQAVTGVPGREPNKLGLYAPLFLRRRHGSDDRLRGLHGGAAIGGRRAGGPLDPGGARHEHGPRRTESYVVRIQWRPAPHDRGPSPRERFPGRRLRRATAMQGRLHLDHVLPALVGTASAA